MVPRAGQDALPRFLRRHFAAQLLVQVAALHVVDLVDGCKIHIGKAQLLPLIDERSALECELKRRQQLCQRRAHSRVRIHFAHHARVVVVFKKQAHPAVVTVILLPVQQVFFQVAQVVPVIVKAGLARVLQRVEVEHHVQLRAALRGEHFGHLHAQARRLAHSDGVVTAKALPPHLCQIFVQARAVKIMLDAPQADGSRQRLAAVSQAVLRDQVDDVHAETVHALGQPPVDHVIDLAAQRGVIPVQVHLLFAEQVQRPFVPFGIVIPRGAGKKAHPVVRLFSVPAFVPDVIVPAGTVGVVQGTLEPGVLVGGVVHHKVHDKLHAVRMCLSQQGVEILHGAELGHDFPVIPDVIAVVVVGGIVYGREPQQIYAQFLQIGQLFADAPQIAHAVAV